MGTPLILLCKHSSIYSLSDMQIQVVTTDKANIMGHSVPELVLMRNWLVRPGWSTSWMAAENIAVIISSGVKTD